VNKYTYKVFKGGGGGSGPLQVNFLYDDILHFSTANDIYAVRIKKNTYIGDTLEKKRPNAKGAGSHWLALEPRNVMTTFKDNLFVNRVKSFV
jgi:hypothetical protein